MKDKDDVLNISQLNRLSISENNNSNSNHNHNNANKKANNKASTYLIKKEEITMNKLNYTNKLFDIEKDNYKTLVEIIFTNNILEFENQKYKNIIQTIENQQNKIQFLFHNLQLIIINNHSNLQNYSNINNIKDINNLNYYGIIGSGDGTAAGITTLNNNIEKSINNLNDWCGYSNQLYEIQKFNNVILKDTIYNYSKENWELDIVAINSNLAQQYRDIQSVINYLNSLEIVDDRNTLTFYYNNSLNTHQKLQQKQQQHQQTQQPPQIHTPHKTQHQLQQQHLQHQLPQQHINEGRQGEYEQKQHQEHEEEEEEEYVNPNDEYIEPYDSSSIEGGENVEQGEIEQDDYYEEEEVEEEAHNNRYQNFTFLNNTNTQNNEDENEIIDNGSLQQMLSATSTLLSNKDLNQSIINNNEYSQFHKQPQPQPQPQLQLQQSQHKTITKDYLINNIIKDLIELSNDLIDEVGRLKDENQNLQLNQSPTPHQQQLNETISSLPPIKNIKDSIENITNINNNINNNLIRERDDLLVRVFTMEQDIGQLKTRNEQLQQDLVEKSLQNFNRIKELDLIKSSSANTQKNEKLIESLKQLCDSKEGTIKFYKKENESLQKQTTKLKQELQQEKSFNQKTLSNWDELQSEYKKLELNYNNLLSFNNSKTNGNNSLIKSTPIPSTSNYLKNSNHSSSSSTSLSSTSSSLNTFSDLPDSINIYKSNINQIKDTLILNNQMRHSTNSYK